MSADAGDFAAIAVALYAAHHVGDYWVQRDVDAKHKGDPGTLGRLHCAAHVTTYLMTQVVFLIMITPLIPNVPVWTTIPALIVSGVTHYVADRRAPLRKIASWIPGKGNFVQLGVPRAGQDDNPQLATGLWALDQSWHIFWGVFVAALVMVIL